MSIIDSEWKQFLQNMDMSYTLETYSTSSNEDTQPEYSDTEDSIKSTEVSSTKEVTINRMPCEELYISTQTRIFFLNVHHLKLMSCEI